MAEVLIAALDLLEAEGRALKGSLRGLGLGLGLVLGAAAVFAVASALLLLALFLFLAPRSGLPGAALVCGLVALAVSGGLLWAARRLSR